MRYFLLIILFLFIFINKAFSYCAYNLQKLQFPCENYKDEICKVLDDKFILENEYKMSKSSQYPPGCELGRSYNHIDNIKKEDILENYLSKNYNLEMNIYDEKITVKNIITEYGYSLFGFSVELDGIKIRSKNYSKIIKKNKDKVKDLDKLSLALYFNTSQNPLLSNKPSRSFYCNNCNLENIDLKSMTIGWDSINSNFNNSNLSKINTHLTGLGVNGSIVAYKDTKDCKNFMTMKYEMACKVYSGVGKAAINLSGSTFINANLKSANLRYADLKNTNFTGADLRQADLRFTDLRNAIFIGSNLQNANFTGAILDGAIFEDNESKLAIFDNTIFENSELDTRRFDKLAITLGCNPSKRKKLDKCVKKIMKSQFNADINLQELKQNFIVMENIQKKIEIINIAKNNNYNPNASKKNKPPKEYGEGEPEWKIDQSGRGYWDYGNGMGWMPPNQIYDDIISGFSLPNWQKDHISIGSGGPVTVWDNGTVSKWNF